MDSAPKLKKNRGTLQGYFAGVLWSFWYGGNGGIQNRNSQALKESDSELVEDS